ncbi:MAG: hypothetical protein U9N78_03980 [Actinomycetota bacterium]|nr:hypothetical protein [Actinomycetota bacterium]
MYHQHQLVNPYMDGVAEDIRRSRNRRAIGRGSPVGPGSLRSLIAKILVLTGARVHGSTPAVIGDRVVLLDPCRDSDLRLAA